MSPADEAAARITAVLDAFGPLPDPKPDCYPHGIAGCPGPDGTYLDLTEADLRTVLGDRKDTAAALDAVYRERAHLVALLAALFPATWDHDPTTDWIVVYVQLPTGQASWHIASDDWGLFGHVLQAPTLWDWHTTDEKYERIRKLTADKVTEPRPAVPDSDRTEWGIRFTDSESGVSSVGNYGPVEAYVRRIAAEDPAHSTILHRRVIRRADCFGEWIEDGPEASAPPTPRVSPFSPNGETAASIEAIKQGLLDLANPDASPGQ